VPSLPHVYGAYGYGGNGITFSYLATQMIGAMMSGGVYRDWFDDFAMDRDGPGGQSPKSGRAMWPAGGGVESGRGVRGERPLS
jgi:glycine/D-amino acid oxidase-like deaminating enzyme